MANTSSAKKAVRKMARKTVINRVWALQSQN